MKGMAFENQFWDLIKAARLIKYSASLLAPSSVFPVRFWDVSAKGVQSRERLSSISGVKSPYRLTAYGQAGCMLVWQFGVHKKKSQHSSYILNSIATQN